MAQTHQVVSNVSIAPGCIVCDVCTNACPEVFEVRDENCFIRDAAIDAEFLKPRTPAILSAQEDCPVDVIKIQTVEVDGRAPWVEKASIALTSTAAGNGSGTSDGNESPTSAAADPKWQALLNTAKIGGVNGRKTSPVQSLPKRRLSRREFSLSLAVGWGAVIATGGAAVAMFANFMRPNVLREPKSVYRVGRVEEYGNADTVYEAFKSDGIWLVNLLPDEPRLVALSTTCTHLGCIPNWLAADQKFKCPCHGSGYYISGVNFEGPAPRPLERYAISRDADGLIVVDKGRVFRQELGEWDNPDSFLALG